MLGINNKSVFSDNAKERKVLWIFLSFAIPFFIMVLGCIAMHITPFGDKSLIISDGDSYLNCLSYFSRLLKGEESILYSFENGLGNNMISYFSWGQFSPIFALSALADLETLPVWYTWISITCLSFSGLTMYILLDQLTGHRSSNLIFAVSYALAGFSVANDFQIIFFTGVHMLPLMVLGLYRMLKGKNPVLYIASLGYCILCNFYFGYMLCVFSLLLFIVIMVTKKQELYGKRKRLFGRFALSSVLAGLLPTFIWLPAIKAMTGGGRVDQAVLSEFKLSENMPFLEIFAKLFTGANSTEEIVSGLPNIFCGILILALVILFFMNKKIEKRYKRAAGVVIIFYLISFYITAFTMAMHGFTHTNWFPYRYSFIFSFVLIMLAAEQFRHIDSITFKECRYCGIMIIVSAIIIFSRQYEFITGGMILIDIILLFGMWAAFYLYKKRPSKTPLRLLSAILILLVSINMYANYTISTYKLLDWGIDLDEYEVQILQDGSMAEGITASDDTFFRMENEDARSGTLGLDSYLYGYNGVGGSGPVIRSFVHEQLCKLGINWFDMRHYYSEGIPAAADTLLGVKYVISENDLTEEKGYTQKLNAGAKGIFLNENALSIAILADAAASEVELGSDVFANLNRIYKAMTGEEEDIFTEETDITFTSHNSTEGYTVTSEELSRMKEETDSEDAAETEADAGDADETEADAGDADETEADAYIEYEFTAASDGTVYLFDTAIPDSESGLYIPAIKCCGVYKKGDLVTGRLDISGDYITPSLMEEYCSGLVWAYADNDLLSEYAEILNDREITLAKEQETLLTGEFSADEDQIILFTIPWDEGWSCYIDGEKTEISKTWDLFMSVEATEGSHTYELRYFPAWMDYGIVISLAALAGAVIYIIIYAVKKRDDEPLTTQETEGAQEF